MVYSIEVNGVESIVFGKAFRVPSGQYPPIIKDIMGNTVSMHEALIESSKNSSRDSLINCTCCKIKRNMELGLDIVAKWREYCVIKAAELGITGVGLTQLNAFSDIGIALSFGCLAEAAQLIPSMTEDSIVTAEIKAKFVNACISADHMD